MQLRGGGLSLPFIHITNPFESKRRIRPKSSKNFDFLEDIDARTKEPITDQDRRLLEAIRLLADHECAKAIFKLIKKGARVRFVSNLIVLIHKLVSSAFMFCRCVRSSRCLYEPIHLAAERGLTQVILIVRLMTTAEGKHITYFFSYSLSLQGSLYIIPASLLTFRFTRSAHRPQFRFVNPQRPFLSSKSIPPSFGPNVMWRRWSAEVADCVSLAGRGSRRERVSQART